MSGPKYVEFNVNCNDDERLEIIQILNEADKYGRGRGVSYTGSRNLNIRVDNYSSMSVSEVKALVAEAKKRVAERNEQRRREELEQAKKSELIRIDSAVKEIENISKTQIAMIDSAIRECETKIAGLKRAKTNTHVLSSVSAEGLGGTIEMRVDTLRHAKEEILRQSQERVAEFAQYRSRISSFSEIEELNKAILSAPSVHLSAVYNANLKQEIIDEIKKCSEIFMAFRDYLSKIEGSLKGREDVSGLIRKLNSALEEHSFVTVDDIESCIELLKKHYQNYAAQQRTEEMRKMATFIEQLTESVKKIKISVDGSVKIGTGVDYKKLIEEVADNSQRIIERIKKFEYITPGKRKAISDLTLQLEQWSGSEKNAHTEAEIRKCLKHLEQIEISCSIDEKKYQEFKQLEIKLNRLKKQAEAAGIDDVAIINFDANYAEQRIRQIQTEIDRLEHDIAIVMRNGRASEIVSSLVNKANGSAGQYQILSDEIIAGENRCLRFVKPGSFGVVYEYVVEPGGNVRRDVRGVMIDGQAVIGKEALIKKKHTDCADVDFLRKDMAEMGASMRVTELQTPEDSSDIEGYLALNADIAQTYLRQVLSEDEWVHVDEIVMRAKSGEGYEDIKATIETANAATGETSDDDTATATLHMKTGEDW